MAKTTPKPFVFVLMPFSQDFDDVYKLGIGPACKGAGAYCERVDEQIYTENIMERIRNQIAKADLIVSDLTGQNPNVFYETGYAHALGKTTILLTQKAEDIPFDLKHTPHIVYGKSVSGIKPELRRRIKYFIDHPTKTQMVTVQALAYYVNGQNIEVSPSVNVAINDHQRNLGWTITIGIHNRGDAVIETNDIQFGFVWPTILGDPATGCGNYSQINESTYMIDISSPMFSLLPAGWIHKPIQIMNREIHETYDPFSLTVKQRRKNQANNPPLTVTQGCHNCSVRTFTAFGTREFPFTIWVK